MTVLKDMVGSKVDLVVVLACKSLHFCRILVVALFWPGLLDEYFVFLLPL